MKNTSALKVTTPTDCEIVLTRELDAPRHLVWEAMNKPEYLRRWLLGPPGWEMVVCEVDLRVGGTFRHEWRNVDGTAMAMHGVFREVVAPERIVRTEIFEYGCDAQAGEQLATMVLTEKNGKTTVTITALFPSKQARDGMIASGMEQGVAAGYDRLDGILAEMQKE